MRPAPRPRPCRAAGRAGPAASPGTRPPPRPRRSGRRALLDEQRDVVDEHLRTCGGRVAEQLRRALGDPRWVSALSLARACGSANTTRPSGPVEPAVRLQHLRPTPRRRRQARCAHVDHLPRDHVGVDDDSAVRPQQTADGGLPGTMPPVSPTVRLVGRYPACGDDDGGRMLSTRGSPQLRASADYGAPTCPLQPPAPRPLGTPSACWSPACSPRRGSSAAAGPAARRPQRRLRRATAQQQSAPPTAVQLRSTMERLLGAHVLLATSSCAPPSG
jgi:hypothetical protein